MKTSERLKFLRGINQSDLPQKLADSVKDYLEIADDLDNDEELFPQVKGFESDVELLYNKVKELDKSSSGGSKAKGSAKGKATKNRIIRAKSVKAGRTADTKKKAEKRAENKPKAEVKPKVESKPKVEKSASKPKTEKPATKPKADKAPSKAIEKQQARLREVRAEYKKWTEMVDEQDENLRKVVKLVSSAVQGMGLTKLQLEIKQYEAYITILKKIYARDLRMQKTIMDKAKAALQPLQVQSLQKAIVKAQGIYDDSKGLSGLPSNAPAILSANTYFWTPAGSADSRRRSEDAKLSSVERYLESHKFATKRTPEHVYATGHGLEIDFYYSESAKNVYKSLSILRDGKKSNVSSLVKVIEGKGMSGIDKTLHTKPKKSKKKKKRTSAPKEEEQKGFWGRLFA